MINQKIAFITGASRGIGNATALRLAEDGFGIAVLGVTDEERAAAGIHKIKQTGCPFLYINGDVASDNSRREAVKKVLDRFGRIDVLVNNAGVGPKVRMDILEATEESMDYVLGINLKGTFFMTQLVSKIMIREVQEIEGIKPKIINISSISAYTSSVNRGEYCISKAGTSMITALFADRLAEYGINVYEIRPGIIMTDMTAKVKDKYDTLIENGITPIKRWGYPEDVAKAVSVLCSGMLEFSTGEVINVDGGFHLKRL